MSEPLEVDSHLNLEILIFAPTGQDAKLLSSALLNAGIESKTYLDVKSICERLSKDAGAVLIAEESLTGSTVTLLNGKFAEQEPWSDIPIVVMTAGQSSLNTDRVINTFANKGNVTLIERPFRRATLKSIIQVALRSRSRQYQVRKLLEEQLKATKMRDEFISIAGHELKTPLTSLKLETQMNKRVLERSESNSLPYERAKRLVENTNSQINKLARLVEDMLDISRVTTGKLALAKSPTDLSKLVEQVVNGMRPQLALAKCELSVQFCDHLEVLADQYRVEQVINNLLTNVIRYAPGQPVSVSTDYVDGFARIIVEDYGRGISVEDQQRIFERFERAVSSENISGLGVGLYICREIVESHGGAIAVQSTLGAGSKFYVLLPISVRS